MSVKSSGGRTGRDLEQERPTSWLELFFDLVYVLAIAQLAHGLVEDPTLHGFLILLALFVPVWWAWVGFTFYVSRFQHDDVPQRLLFLLAMAASAALAISVRDAFHGETVAYALSYALVRTVLVVMYLSELVRDEQRQRAARFLSAAFGISIAIWVASAFVEPPGRYVMWTLALAIELGAPVVGVKYLRTHPVDGSHLPERFGLFVIIVLGESVVAAGTLLAGADWGAITLAAAALGFTVVAALWWQYFDASHGSLQRTLVDRGHSWRLARDVFSYGHFPLVVGLTMVAAGAELLILDAGRDELRTPGRWFLAGGAALFLAGLSAIHLALADRRGEPLIWGRFAAGMVLCALASAAGLAPLVFGSAVAAVMVAVAALSYVRNRS